MPDNDNTQTFTQNEDGTISITVEGKPVKYAKESDLLTVKGGAERKEGEFLSQIAEANRLKDEAHTKFLEATAAKEQLEEQAREGATSKEKVVELTAQVTATEESRKQLEEELLGMKRTHLASAYGVSEDSLKDKNADQLKNLGDALQLVGNKGKPANYDKGPSGATPTAPTSILEGCKQELVVAKEQRAKRSQGDSDYQA